MTDSLGSFAQALKTIADRLADPMPDWAFCPKKNCGLLLMDMPGVYHQVVKRIGVDRVSEAPRCRCDQNRIVATRQLFASSNIPNQMPPAVPRMFDNFSSRYGAEHALSAAESFRETPVKVLTLQGGTGRGKSHLAEAICREYLGRGVQACYEHVPALLDAMRASYDQNTAQMAIIMQRCTDARLLVLDDLGQEKASEWTSERLTTLVDSRMRHATKTVVATNQTQDELAAVGYERLASRMWATGTKEAVVAVLTCSDYRMEVKE